MDKLDVLSERYGGVNIPSRRLVAGGVFIE